MNRGVSKDRDLRDRLLATDLLRELKASYTYKELSKILGLQESLLCRYVNGTTVPSEQQARDLIEKIKQKNFITKFFLNKIKTFPDSFIDTSELLHYPNMLRLLLEDYLSKYSEVNKVVGIANNGIPFATLVSVTLNRPLIVVKKHRDSVYLEYLEESLRESDSIVSNLYVRKSFISKSDKILIVDDVMKTGKTIISTTKLIRKGNGLVKGAFVMVTVGKAPVSLEDVEVEAVFRL
ncbi:phosphoribosyltransferase [Metallosphaera tengchongensis]|uniref:Phosphoribosyltransferase n=1 Tax=Metallosphaera tengchongensis TaxID=1532350 RepID=A0A6N0NUL2_9CREN|nr:phosphoribosyltransferase family protein [Metallosphaera tengchongensis]QKQ99844.1 phosphoribosyltransferase [Metallosphaera tengchongensis]